jgi:hypothetical protein
MSAKNRSIRGATNRWPARELGGIIRLPMTPYAVPSSLPPIDAAEVVDLAQAQPDQMDRFVAAAAAAGTRCVRVADDAEAQRIAAMFRALPPGEQMRCHIPPFGLRFFAGGRPICEASICWECNNVHGWAGEQPLFYEFDAALAPSRELLAACRRAFGWRPADAFTAEEVRQRVLGDIGNRTTSNSSGSKFRPYLLATPELRHYHEEPLWTVLIERLDGDREGYHIVFDSVTEQFGLASGGKLVGVYRTFTETLDAM